ncbi:MAG: c-type cytochrome [Nitrosomonas sp.]|uniref:c-type cytochrome n=1 Tax=Nitrosomonas sp. TaxID=42353 RepID=UPI001D658DB7|nr:c-type cytochrome [Nitrosomonas sp.]MBX9636476.1 c-type cytochrome [Nitrosomonas sp.]MBY0483019.1 c-type cytochrome [Nitrosomonas sp.]
MAKRNILLCGIAALLLGCGDSAPLRALSGQSQIDSQTGLVKRNFDQTQIKRGESVYAANCVGCHGLNGEATPDWRKPGPDGKYPPPPLDSTAHAWHHSTEVLKKTILKGTPPDIGSMPAWEGKLTEQQVDDVIVWIKSLWSDEIYDIWYKNFEGK